MAAHHAHPRREFSEGAENAIKAIYLLQGRDDEGEVRVHTGKVAERLGVTPASASAMIRRLDAEGLADHSPYRGVRLTAAGEERALEMIRHHRLIELFLAEVLGMPWDRVHAEAEVLEHHISEELEELIAAKLGQPVRDPHGDPIPDREFSLDTDDSLPLAELEPGAAATFERISDSDGAMLRYLDERDIRPGVRLRVLSREPFGGPTTVDVEGRTHQLGSELVRQMRVSESPQRRRVAAS